LVETIRASGHVRRANRPNTRLLLINPNRQIGLAKREPSTQDKAGVGNDYIHATRRLHQMAGSFSAVMQMLSPLRGCNGSFVSD
jgi:hypothetical protein